ncbi:MAG: hypothetical protein AAF628_12870 [Planctomycetota bacterium]
MSSRFITLTLTTVSALTAVALGSHGRQMRAADALPGERDAYDAAAGTASLNELPQTMPVRPVEPAEAAAVLERLKAASPPGSTGPIEVELEVLLYRPGSPEAAARVPLAVVQRGAEDWQVHDRAGGGGLHIGHGERGLYGGLPWLPESVTRWTGAGGVASPLVLPACYLSAEHLVGVHDQYGVAKFALHSRESSFGRVDVSVDLESGLVRHVLAMAQDGAALVQKTLAVSPVPVAAAPEHPAEDLPSVETSAVEVPKWLPVPR